MNTIPEMPALEIDAWFRARGWTPDADALIERRIAWALLHKLADLYPRVPLVVFDGDENTRCDEPKQAMELIFNLDEAMIRCGRAWVLLIVGNGVDIISDYGVSDRTEAAVDGAMKAAGVEV